jgi:hypothetical protein
MDHQRDNAHGYVGSSCGDPFFAPADVNVGGGRHEQSIRDPGLVIP